MRQGIRLISAGRSDYHSFWLLFGDLKSNNTGNVLLPRGASGEVLSLRPGCRTITHIRTRLPGADQTRPDQTRVRERIHSWSTVAYLKNQNMAEAPTTAPQTIVVIGAGVLGLTTSNLLLSAHPTKRIVVVTAELPTDEMPSTDYASAWAGAHYRPIPASTPQLKQEAQFGYRGYEIMRRMTKDEPDAGVRMILGVEHFEVPSDAHLALKDGDMYAGKDDQFRILRKDELPSGVVLGYEYQTYCVNVPIYCSYLLARFLKNGGQVVKEILQNAAAAFEVAGKRGQDEVPVIVNCSGRNFDSDSGVSIIRGQTCLVKNKYDKTITRQNRDGTWATLIPRPLNGGTIVGVSKEAGDTESSPRKATRHRMFRQAIEAFPDFVRSVDELDVIKDNVGRRPFREGGLRLEIESLGLGDRKIIHGYGAGGRGYELSWGIGQKLLELVEEALNQQSAEGSVGVRPAAKL